MMDTPADVGPMTALLKRYDDSVQDIKVKLDLWDRNQLIPEEMSDLVSRSMFRFTADMDVLAQDVRKLHRWGMADVANELFRAIDAVRVGVAAVMKLLEELKAPA